MRDGCFDRLHGGKLLPNSLAVVGLAASAGSRLNAPGIGAFWFGLTETSREDARHWTRAGCPG